MRRASDLFHSSQRDQVQLSVMEAEAKTSCEIVPVVASASGRYDRPEDLVGLWCTVFSVVAFWCLSPQRAIESGSWENGFWFVELLALVATILVSFVIGTVAGSRLSFLRRLLTPHKQMQEEVASQARQIFFDQRVHHTSDATGLLIYISLFEQTVMVLGDQKILNHPHLGQSFLDQLCNQLTQKIRQGDFAEALCQTISQAGQRLAEPLPREKADVNELQDTLILIDLVS